MLQLRSCIHCKAYFKSATYSSDETIQLLVYVRSELNFDINFVSNFSIHFNHNVRSMASFKTRPYQGESDDFLHWRNGLSTGYQLQVYDSQCAVTDPRVLGLVAGRTHTFNFTFPANQQHVGGQIKVSSISIHLIQKHYGQ